MQAGLFHTAGRDAQVPVAEDRLGDGRHELFVAECGEPVVGHHARASAPCRPLTGKYHVGESLLKDGRPVGWLREAATGRQAGRHDQQERERCLERRATEEGSRITSSGAQWPLKLCLMMM